MAGKAKFDIVAEDKTAAAWRSALGNAKTSTDRIRGMLGAAFAGVGIGAIASLSLKAIALGDDLNRAAIAAGISGKALSQLAYVAKQSDVELKTLSTSIKKMQIALSEARTGGKQQIETLQALGLTIKDLQGLDADKQFEILGDRISLLKDPTDRARAAVELFGKAGADLLPLFADGAQGIQKLRHEADQIGATLSDDQIRALADADNAIKKLDSSWEHFWAKMVARAGNSGVTDWLNRLSGSMPLEQKVRQQQFLVDNENGWESDESRERHKRTLQALLREQDIANSHPELGGRGTRVSGSGPALPDAPPGFKAPIDPNIEKNRIAALMAEDARQKERMREWEAERVEMQKYFEDFREKNRKAIEGSVDDLNKSLDKVRFSDLTENFRMVGRALKDGIDDAIRTGKFNMREFLSFIVAEFARQKIAELFSTIASNYNKSGASAGGGILGTIIGAISSAWTGSSAGSVDGRASGGATMAGRTYLVGEEGPELFRSGMSGAIVPNHALRGGGGINVAPVINIDARGATVDAIKLLPSFGKQISETTEARIVERIRRDFYGFNQ